MKRILFPASLALLLLFGCDASASSSQSSSASSSSQSSQSSLSEVNTLKPGQLFDHGVMGESQFYNYAPTIFEEDGKRYIYFCSNYIEGNVTDVIGYREGTENAEGKWVYSDFDYVFGPTEDTWDSRHTCDPSVIKGQFQYDGVSYSYLMAYLGCITSNNQLNEVGMAVANSPAGPWIKTNKINPIAKYEKKDNGGFEWGYGQPSLVSVDRASRVLLFYTVGDGTATYTQVERWDFSNLNEPIMEAEKVVPTKGLNTFISNADFAYDPVKKRIYMISDDRPFPTSSPDFIAGSNIFTYFNEYDSTEGYEVGDTLFTPFGQSWNIMTRVNDNVSGYPKNHNMGIVTDPYGWIEDSENVEVVYAVSIEAEGFWWSLSSYRLFITKIEITE